MTNRLRRLYFILTLSSCIFFAELVISIRTGSVALKADAFHVLSDVIATIITIYSIRIVTKDKTPHATYGWLRSEIIGGLANSVFLLALAFNILIEAIEKLIDIDEIKDKLEDGIDEVFIVGFIGLGVNLIALFVIHGSDDHHDHKEFKSYISVSSTTESIESTNHIKPTSEQHTDNKQIKKGKKKNNVNTRGLLLHVIGDILGSVVVIISSSTIKYASGDFRFYLDPGVSLCTVTIIGIVTFPLLFKCRRILLHHVPKSIDMDQLKKDLYKISNIKDIHELHIWQLDDQKLVGSLHFNIEPTDDIPKVLKDTILNIKSVFHGYGIHSTTIQPEYHITDKDGFENVDISDCVTVCKNLEETGEIRINIKPDCIDVQCNDNCHQYKCCK